jgi:hypothetical protein
LFFILQKAWITSANTKNFGLSKTRDSVPEALIYKSDGFRIEGGRIF